MNCLDSLPHFESFTYRIAVLPPVMETLWSDLRHSMRSLLRDRGFAAVAILTRARRRKAATPPSARLSARACRLFRFQAQDRSEFIGALRRQSNRDRITARLQRQWLVIWISHQVGPYD